MDATTSPSDSLYSLLPELTSLMRPRASPRAALSLRFSVHWTRISAFGALMPRTVLPPGIHLHAGRPNVRATLKRAITGVRDAYSSTLPGRDDSLGSPSGIVVGSCGPTSLMDDVVRAITRVNWVDWRDVGGVESTEE